MAETHDGAATPAGSDPEAPDSGLNLTDSDIVRHMDQGATLYKARGQSSAELQTPDKGLVRVPASAIELLKEQDQIEPVGGVATGYFRRKD